MSFRLCDRQNNSSTVKAATSEGEAQKSQTRQWIWSISLKKTNKKERSYAECRWFCIAPKAWCMDVCTCQKWFSHPSQGAEIKMGKEDEAMVKFLYQTRTEPSSLNWGVNPTVTYVHQRTITSLSNNKCFGGCLSFSLFQIIYQSFLCVATFGWILPFLFMLISYFCSCQ